MNRELARDAECNVLGALLCGIPESVIALDQLTPQEFGNATLAGIFEIISQVRQESGKFDIALISPKLDPTQKEAAGTCMDFFLSMANYQDYIRIVKEQAQKRRITNRLSEIVYGGADDPLGEITQILEAENKAVACNDFQAAFIDNLQAYFGQLHSPNAGQERIKTGWTKLDKTIGGLRRKTLSYIGARPSTGKTAFALNILQNQVKTDNKCVFFSLEMSVSQLFERHVSKALRIDYGRINANNLTTEERDRIGSELISMGDKQQFYFIDDIYSIEGIASAISKLRPQLVIVDFLQCVRTMQKFQTRRNEIDHLSQEFKRLAKHYDCHIIVLSQLSRAGQEMPRMSDLKESGSLEQDGDYIMILHRPYVLDKGENTDPGTTSFLLDKNKYGHTGKIDMYFTGQYQWFTEVERYEQ